MCFYDCTGLNCQRIALIDGDIVHQIIGSVLFQNTLYRTFKVATESGYNRFGSGRCSFILFTG